MKGYSHKYFDDVFWYETEENSNFVLYHEDEKDIYYFYDFIHLVKDIDTMSPVIFLQKLLEIKVLAAHKCIFPPKNWVKRNTHRRVFLLTPRLTLCKNRKYSYC